MHHTRANSPCYKNQEKLLDLVKQGLSLHAIAKAIGSKGCTVREYLKRHGIHRERLSQAGDKNPAWNGGRRIDKDGYVEIWCPAHPNARKHTGVVLEHRLVMEKKIGRHLRPEEVVHHKDDDHANNSPENLVLYASNAEHLAATLRGRCPKWTPEGRAAILAGSRKKRGPKRKPSPAESAQHDPRSPKKTVLTLKQRGELRRRLSRKERLLAEAQKELTRSA